VVWLVTAGVVGIYLYVGQEVGLKETGLGLGAETRLKRKPRHELVLIEWECQEQSKDSFVQKERWEFGANGAMPGLIERLSAARVSKALYAETRSSGVGHVLARAF
jgi:hypothetical protein